MREASKWALWGTLFPTDSEKLRSSSCYDAVKNIHATTSGVRTDPIASTTESTINSFSFGANISLNVCCVGARAQPAISHIPLEPNALSEDTEPSIHGKAIPKRSEDDRNGW